MINDPCPKCGKERGLVIGDFPLNYFCRCAREFYGGTVTYSYASNDAKIIALLEEILMLLRQHTSRGVPPRPQTPFDGCEVEDK